MGLTLGQATSRLFEGFGVTVLLCTATQPALNGKISGEKTTLDGIEECTGVIAREIPCTGVPDEIQQSHCPTGLVMYISLSVSLMSEKVFPDSFREGFQSLAVRIRCQRQVRVERTDEQVLRKRKSAP